jgi:hypothetical protein
MPEDAPSQEAQKSLSFLHFIAVLCRMQANAGPCEECGEHAIFRAGARKIPRN